jgi:hypothetical protein
MSFKYVFVAPAFLGCTGAEDGTWGTFPEARFGHSLLFPITKSSELEGLPETSRKRNHEAPLTLALSRAAREDACHLTEVANLRFLYGSGPFAGRLAATLK